MAVLPQLHANAFSNSVREAVSLGRYPHQTGFFSSWSAQDEKAVQHAMLQTGVKRYEHTPMEFYLAVNNKEFCCTGISSNS